MLGCDEYQNVGKKQYDSETINLLVRMNKTCCTFFLLFLFIIDLLDKLIKVIVITDAVRVCI